MSKRETIAMIELGTVPYNKGKSKNGGTYKCLELNIGGYKKLVFLNSTEQFILENYLGIVDVVE